MILKTIFPVIIILFILSSCKDPVSQPEEEETTKHELTWTVDTMFYDLPYMPPDQVNISSIWGSSVNDVWAVGHSDVPFTKIWYYDGKKWTVAKNWPFSGFDPSGTSWINDATSVTGFDKNNVFFAINRYYDDYPDSAMVLKYDGAAWREVPWVNGRRISGGLGDIVAQKNGRLWATNVSGNVVKYENGYLSTDAKLNRHGTQLSLAVLDNGEVYESERIDSLKNNRLQGSITKLFKRDLLGKWSTIEDKFIPGSYEDNNGFALGVFSAGNRVFTLNMGLWERINGGWIKLFEMQDMGGCCMINENNLWVYFRHEIWHLNGKEWEKVNIPLLDNYPGSYLYGRGWSDGNEIFIALHHNSRTYILHGK